MANSRLNKQIFIEADNLASNKSYKNWIAHACEMLKSYCSDYNPAPILSSNQSLQYYKEYLIECSKIRWQTEISEVPAGSDSGGRLALYRQKTQPLHREVPNYYEFTRWQEGYGRSPGWMPASDSGGGRYTGTPYSERVCRLCDCGEVEDQHHFLIICHTLSSIRHNLFTRCLTLSSSFTHLSFYDKCKFLLSTTDNTTLAIPYSSNVPPKTITFVQQLM